MRHRLSIVLFLAIVGTAGLGACGSDEGKRGLQPADEVAAPASGAADAETEEERDEDMVRDLPEGQ